MRRVQIVLFALGMASLIGALFFIGENTGEDLWKAGIALMLVDVVCIQLWPSTRRPWSAHEPRAARAG